MFNKLKKIIVLSIAIAIIPVPANAWQWKDLLDSKIISSFVIGTVALCLGYTYFKKNNRIAMQTLHPRNAQEQLNNNASSNDTSKKKIESNQNSSQHSSNVQSTIPQPQVSNPMMQPASLNASAPTITEASTPTLANSEWAIINAKTERDLPPCYVHGRDDALFSQRLHQNCRLTRDGLRSQMTLTNGSIAYYILQDPVWVLELGFDQHKKKINAEEYEDYIAKKLENRKAMLQAQASSDKSTASQEPASLKSSHDDTPIVIPEHPQLPLTSMQSHNIHSVKPLSQYGRVIEPPRNGLAKYKKMRKLKKEHRLGLQKIKKNNEKRKVNASIAMGQYAIG